MTKPDRFAQRELAAKLANDIRTDKRVGLLKKRTKKDGNAQRQQLLPNDTLRYIDRRRFLSHTPSPHAYVKQQFKTKAKSSLAPTGGDRNTPN